MKKKYNWIYTIIIIFLIDFFSKIWIVNHFYLHENKTICIICNIFYTRNYGAAFSLLSNYHEWTRWSILFMSIISIYSIVYIIMPLEKHRKHNIVPYAFIIGGAIGNTWNRLYYGFVIDFIDLHIYAHHFAIFNIADLSIFVGVITIIIMKCNHLYHKTIQNIIFKL